MIYLRLGFIAIVILVIWLVVKLLRSPKYDKFCNDMAKGNLAQEPTAKDAMKGITDAKKDLGKQVDKNIKEADKLKDESNDINDFLGNRGAVDTKKGEGS